MNPIFSLDIHKPNAYAYRIKAFPALTKNCWPRILGSVVIQFKPVNICQLYQTFNWRFEELTLVAPILFNFSGFSLLKQNVTCSD